MYVCVLEACSARRGQKRALDPLELELQTVVSHRVRHFFFFFNMESCQEVVAHTFIPSTQEADAARVQGQPGLQSKFQDSQGCYTEKPCPEIPMNE